MTYQFGTRSPQDPRTPKLGERSAPVATLLLLTAAAVAVVVGFTLLESVGDRTTASDEQVSGVPTAGATTTAAPTSSVSQATTSPPTTTTTTVTPTASKLDATVVVANASGIDGSATAMIQDLAVDGYTMGAVANSTGPRLEQSVIYYLEADSASLGVARLLAEQIPTAQTLPMPQPPPVDRPLNGATVVLMLGRDAAGRPLIELQNG